MEHISTILERRIISLEIKCGTGDMMKVESDTQMQPYAKTFKTVWLFMERHIADRNFDAAVQEMSATNNLFEKDLLMAVLKELDRVNGG